MGRMEREIDIMREYRTRLIADAATGKVGIREAAAGLPEPDPLAKEEDPDGDSHRHTGSEGSGGTGRRGPVPDVVDAERAEAAAEIMAEGR